MANEQNNQGNPQQGGQNKPGQQQRADKPGSSSGQSKPGQQQQGTQHKPGQHGGQRQQGGR